jgi:hypothetical protein
MMKLFRARTVGAEARRRGVTRLLHSTHLYRNLPSILATGTLHTARSLIEAFGHSRAAHFLHDPNRYEQFAVGLDYINCSLGEPNYELLYRRSKSDWKAEWVHLALDPALLDRNDTLFCPVSAATDRGRFLLAGLNGFQAMFASEVDGWSRRELARSVPTHPQAEVLVRGPLPLAQVEAVLVPNEAVAIEVRRLCEMHGRTLDVRVLPGLFVWPKRLMKE